MLLIPTYLPTYSRIDALSSLRWPHPYNCGWEIKAFKAKRVILNHLLSAHRPKGHHLFWYHQGVRFSGL